LYYAGADYQPLKNLTLSLHTSQLEDLFRRDFAGLKYKIGIGPGDVFTEWRYFSARETGRELLGKVDNRTLSTHFGYSIKGHTFSGGYQKVRGDTAYGLTWAEPTRICSASSRSAPFALANERAWMMRYDYDFATLGVPGLTFNLRYVKRGSGGSDGYQHRQGWWSTGFGWGGGGVGADDGLELRHPVRRFEECFAALAKCDDALEFCRCCG